MRKLLLIAIAAIAALAMAPAANASIQVAEEHGEVNEECTEVDIVGHTPNGGCEIGANTEGATTINLAGHIPGVGEVPQFQCQNTFEARVQESGHGFIYNQTLSNPNPALCPIEPCDEAETGDLPHAQHAWAFHMTEIGATEALGVTFCVRPLANPDVEGANLIPCTVYIPFTSEEHTHEFLTAGTGVTRCSQNPAVSLTGHWIVNENHEDVEITH